MVKFTTYFIVVALLGKSRADQPGHCTRSDLFGAWDFHVSANIETVDLFKTKEVCGHRLPNKIQVINKEFAFKFEKEDVWTVNLAEAYQATATK